MLLPVGKSKSKKKINLLRKRLQSLSKYSKQPFLKVVNPGIDSPE
jgi:hypothetical protein